MKKYALDIPDDDGFDFDIMAISCTESHYKVVHEINSLLSTDLVLDNYLEFTHKEGNEFLFPLYRYTDEELCVEYNLLPNQTSYQPPQLKQGKASGDLFAGAVEESARLIPELENTDYFFMLKGSNRHLYQHLVFEQLRKSEVFATIREIFIEDFKDKRSKGNLLF